MDLEQHRIEGFDLEDWKNGMVNQLAHMGMQTNRANFILSEHDLAKLREVSDFLKDRTQVHLDGMVEMAEARRANLPVYADLPLVSLGEDCLPRTVLAQWGLKKPAMLGEQSTPFDLAVHSTATVAHLLETDWADYVDDEHLYYDADARCCLNRKHQIAFNHEVGEDYVADGYAKLKETYRRRIDRFDALNAVAAEVVYIHHIVRPEEAHVWQSTRRIHDALTRRRGGKPFALVSICSWNPDAPIAPEGREQFADTLFYLDVLKPDRDYVWHSPQQSFTRAGLAYERQIVDGIKASIAAWRRARGQTEPVAIAA